MSDRGIPPQAELTEAVRDLLRWFISHQASEVKRYQALARDAERKLWAFLQTAYSLNIPPKELIELSGVSRQTFFKSIINLKTNPELGAILELVKQDETQVFGAWTEDFLRTVEKIRPERGRP